MAWVDVTSFPKIALEIMMLHNLFFVGFVAMALCGGQVGLASLIGDRITANSYANGGLADSVTEDVLDGPEGIGNWQGDIGYNVQSETISVFSLIDGNTNWNQGILFEFLDLDWVDFPAGVITDVFVISATGDGWSLIDDSNVSFDDHSVLIDAREIVISTPSLDQSVTVQIVASHVPEPTSAAVLLLGIGTLTFIHRRRRC